MVVAAGVAAVALFALGPPAHAGRGQSQDAPRQDAKARPKARQRATPTDRRAAQPAREGKGTSRARPQARTEAPQRGERQPPSAAPRDGAREPPDQQALIRQQQLRLGQYRRQMDQQQVEAARRTGQLQQQHRNAQYAYQQEYALRLRDQQRHIPVLGGYDYGRDPFFSTTPTYRYSHGGRTYDTSQSGVDLVRLAVESGYQEGWRVGLADRDDRWHADYESSFVYQDASYGYSGFYIDREDYRDYFREGFRRGYDDGFYARSTYGRASNGRATLFDAVLGAIVIVESLR
jgi:hypothetical protein